MTDKTPQEYAPDLAEQAKTALEDLTPKQAAAVRNYTQRGSPGYGNKTKSCRMAGYSENTNAHKVFSHPGVKHALRSIRRLQSEEAEQTMQEIASLAPDATEEIKSQLEMGRQLEVIDPLDVFGDDLKNVRDSTDEARLKEINRHNRNVAHLAKERRAAAETLLAYAEGTPEQRMHVTREADEDDVIQMLMDMPRDEFEEIGKRLFGDETKLVRDGGVLEVEAEVVEDDS